MQLFSCLLFAVILSEPLPLRISWPSLKNTAFMSSSFVVEYAADDPSARVLLPSIMTKVRFPLWLSMAAPFGLVIETPFSRIACFLELYNLKFPLEVLPVNS